MENLIKKFENLDFNTLKAQKKVLFNGLVCDVWVREGIVLGCNKTDVPDLLENRERVFGDRIVLHSSKFPNKFQKIIEGGQKRRKVG